MIPLKLASVLASRGDVTDSQVSRMRLALLRARVAGVAISGALSWCLVRLALLAAVRKNWEELGALARLAVAHAQTLGDDQLASLEWCLLLALGSAEAPRLVSSRYLPGALVDRLAAGLDRPDGPRAEALTASLDALRAARQYAVGVDAIARPIQHRQRRESYAAVVAGTIAALVVLPTLGAGGLMAIFVLSGRRPALAVPLVVLLLVFALRVLLRVHKAVTEWVLKRLP